MKKNLMTILTVVMATVLLCATLALTACNCGGEEKPQLTDAPLVAPIIADYTKTAADRAEMFESDDWENGEPFNAFWQAENVSYDNNKMSLSISKRPEKPETQISEYFAGESRSKNFYGYGDFQVRMKPSKIAGTASTFFTCTGPYDKWHDENGAVIKENDHDEIDIEFLGSDTTQVQFNYFAAGVGGHEYMYDLGFDASKEFHDYGFRWTKDDITWFVDNKPVYKVKKSEIKAGETWPEEPGRVLMNYWSGTKKASAWMGEFKDDFSGKSEYLWAASSATKQPDPSTIKPDVKPEPIPADIAWDETVLIPFASTDVYTVTSDATAKKHSVSYTEAKKDSYSNIRADITAAGRNYFGVTLAGKTDKAIAARINLRSADGNIAKKAYVSAGTASVVDGALVTVPANGTVDVAVYYEGELAAIEIMIDSTSFAPLATNANTLEISNMKFGVKGDVIIPETGKNQGVKINDNVVKFVGSSDYKLESNADKSAMTVKYTDLPGKDYANIVGDVSSFIGNTNNSFTFEVKNNGAETAKIRIDIGCNAGEGTPFTKGGTVTGKNNFCNTSAIVTGALAKGNDYDFEGGDWVQIAAGATATITIKFTTGVGAKSIILYMDSSTWDDATTHTGELMFSKMNFSVAA